MKILKSVFVVYSHTDCTEGRGYDFPIAVCAQKMTAIRLAKGKYIQGSDGLIKEVGLREIDGVLYVPINEIVNVIKPSEEDTNNLNKFEAREKLLQKLSNAGILEEDLELLKL